MAEEIRINIVTDSSGNALNNIEAINEEIKKTQQTLNSADFGTDQFNNAKKHLDDLNGSLNDLKGTADTTKGGLGGIGDSIDGLGGPLANAKSGVAALGKQFLALLANPIVAIIAGIAVVLGTLFKAFSRTEKGGNALNKAMTTVSAVFSGFFKVIEPIATFIADVLADAFEELGRQAELAAKGVETIVGFFSPEAAKNVSNFTKGIKDQIQTAQQLADLEAGLLVSRREQRLIEKQALIDAEKLRQVRDDDSKSIKDRMKANEELGAVLEKQTKDELAIANQALQAAKLKLKIDGETTEALDGLAEAQLEILDIQERINGQQSEQLANVNALRREEEAAAKERRDAAIAKKKELEDAERKRRELVLEEEKLLRDIATQNLVDQASREIEIERNKWDDKIALYQEKFGEESEIVKASMIERDAAIAEIETANAEAKLQREREQAMRLAELKLELKELNAGELADDASPEEVAAYYEARREIEAEQFEINQEALRAELEAKAITEEEFKLRSDINEANSNKNKKALAKDEADYKKALKKQEVDNAIGAASNILASISTIAGEGSAIAKAAAVGQATMDTYKSAVAAYAAGSSVGGPAGLVLGPLAAGLAVTAGVLNVKKILSTKTPGKKGGGISVPGAPSGGSASAPTINTESLFSTQNLEGAPSEEVGNAEEGQRQNTIKAIVVERDITNSQNNISNIEQQSEIG